MKRLAQITLTIGATLIAIGLMWVFQPTLILFGGSLAISAALRPLVQQLERRGISRSYAILIWYLLIFAALTVGVMLYAVGITDEIARGAEDLPRAYASLIATLKQGSPVQQTVAGSLPDFSSLLSVLVQDNGGVTGVGGSLLGLSSNLASSLLFAFAALSLAYYWLIEVAHFERIWLSLLPITMRPQARTIWRNAEVAVGAYIRATLIAVGVAALLLLALFRVVQLPFATLLALVAGLSQFIPRLGPVAAVIVAFGVALVALPIWQALLVLVIGLAIQYATHVFAERAMQADALKVNAFLQVLLLLALAELGGLWALIFAPPLAALIQVLYAGILSSSSTQPQQAVIDMLCERLDRIKSLPEADQRELVSTMRRSDDLLTQARNVLNNN